MRILLLCNSIGKGYAATAHLAAELAEGLVTRGCEVDVWCRGESREHAVPSCGRSVGVHGMDDQLCQRFKNRHLSELMLLWAFCRWAGKTPVTYDRVICMDSPRFAGLAAGILSKRSGAQTLAWVMDLALEQVARRAAGRPAGRVARWLTQRQVRQWAGMDRIVTLGTCMAALLEKAGVPREKIEVIGTWGEDSWADLAIDGLVGRERFGFNGRFIIMYSGYAGTWHDFESIGEAIMALRDNTVIQWVFAGSGPGIDHIRDLAGSLPSGRIVVMDRVDREDLAALLSCADVHLVSLRAEMLGTCVPSKLYPLMALGKPVAFVGPAACQTALDLEQAQAGLVVGNGRELVEALRGLVHDPERLQAMGENARQAFQNGHNATSVIDGWLAALKR